MPDGRGLDMLVNTVDFCFSIVAVHCFGLQFSRTGFTWLESVQGMTQDLLNHKLTICNSLKVLCFKPTYGRNRQPSLDPVSYPSLFSRSQVRPAQV